LGVLAASGGESAYAQAGSARLFDAANQGVFNVGPAHATVTRLFDPATGNEVLKLDYTIPPGTAAGFWANGFPGLYPDSVDVVRVGLRAAEADPLRHIAAALEIKGPKDRQGYQPTQRIPLNFQPVWTVSNHTVDWQTIRALTEVVVSINRAGVGEPAAGTLFLDIRFERFFLLRKLGTLIGGVLLLSLFAALLTVALRRAWSAERRARNAESEEPTSRSPLRSPRQETWIANFKRDFVLGAGTVLTGCLGFGIYLLGASSILETGWTALGVAVAGGLLAEWWKFGLAGKHLTAGELFRNMLVSGLLAASASPLPVLQAPSWTDCLFLSRTAAAIAALVYHAANAVRLASSGKHLNSIGSTLIVATPYLVSGLLLLASDRLPQTLGQDITLSGLTAWPVALAFLGRVLLLFCFNEAVANGLALATKRTVLKSWRAHLSIFLVSVAAIIAPRIADYRWSAMLASYHGLIRLAATLLATIASQAGLWAEVYLITGMVLDAIHGIAPNHASVRGQAIQGMQKGMIFSGIYMGIVFGLGTLWELPGLRRLADGYPMTVGLLLGTLAFPLLKTIIESFDGSPAFLRRLAKSYQDPILYLRGALVGLAVGYAYSLALNQRELSNPIVFGFGVGVAAFAGVNIFRDCWFALWGGSRPQSWRVYLVQALLGGFIGAAVGFYFDASQLAIVKENFLRYFDLGLPSKDIEVYTFVSKWGRIDLGLTHGGSSLLFAQSLAGVITWSVAAWLFAINRAFMEAYFRRETAPITGLFSAGGMVGLTENMIYVLRWGLWMSPIINSFLRPMEDPTWYNQDGAIRTLIATYHDLTMSPAAFRVWSLNVFIALLVYDAVRILIWLDHMGLRVATLVNLSFLGMDKLEERLARFLAPAATARCIPEAVKRFTTWAPLLIPFYIPRGHDWDYAWGQYQASEAGAQGGPVAALTRLPLVGKLLLVAAAMIVSTMVFAMIRWLRNRFATPSLRCLSLSNTVYEVTLKENGELISQVRDRGYDVSRRSYDFLDPTGGALFLVDASSVSASSPRVWPVLGNFPEELATAPQIESNEHRLKISQDCNGLRTTLEISLPGMCDPVERWTITVENRSGTARPIKIVPYLEWVLNKPEADRGHTQYNRLFAEMEYVSGLHAVLAWDKHSKAMGLLAADVAPEGFLTSRMDFIGRARSIWMPRALETLAFAGAEDTDAHPTFDPIGSLLLGTTLPAHGTFQMRLLMGLTRNKQEAMGLIAHHLRVPGAETVSPSRQRKLLHPIGHGEIPPGTPQPYFEFSEGGRRLSIRTPFTPRPYDHTMSNSRGHVVVVTNRGLHTSASVNAQQNRLTPDWSDTVTREIPAEAFYLYDPDRQEWFSPTYHPLNDTRATHEVEFGVDGTATYRMARETLETELTVFVPPDEPAGFYLLTVRNHADAVRRLRLAPYFQMVLADSRSARDL
jgi:cyclic beta-1,2-glucan synthetase